MSDYRVIIYNVGLSCNMQINVRKMYISIFRNEFCSKIILTGTGNIKYFRVLIRGLGVIDWRKKPRVKNLVTVSL
jgi:hypothetical protein